MFGEGFDFVDQFHDENFLVGLVNGISAIRRFRNRPASWSSRSAVRRYQPRAFRAWSSEPR
jgi:hypothetical protein